MIGRADVLMALACHIGQPNGASVGQLVLEITGDYTTPAGERQVRERIHDLRMDGEHVCAHPTSGYYLAATPAELDRTCRFLVDRAMSSLSQVSRMKRISLPDLYGQFRLPD